MAKMSDDSVGDGEKQRATGRLRAAPDERGALERFSALVEGYIESGGRKKINKYRMYKPHIKRLVDHGESERRIYELLREAKVGMSREIMKRLILEIRDVAPEGGGVMQSTDHDGRDAFNANVATSAPEARSTEQKASAYKVEVQEDESIRRDVSAESEVDEIRRRLRGQIPESIK